MSTAPFQDAVDRICIAWSQSPAATLATVSSGLRSVQGSHPDCDCRSTGAAAEA